MEKNKFSSFLNGYHNDLITVEGKSKNTSETYLISIKIFTNWLLEKNLDLENLSIQDLMTFFVTRQTQSDETTVAKEISAIRSFGSYLVRLGVWKENLGFLLERPRKSIKIPKVLSVDEVETLLASIDVSTSLGIRDRALFEIIYSSGLRISEVSGLLLQNIYLKEGILFVLGKGNKERTVYLDQVAAMTLQAYLEARKDNSPALFAGKGTDRLQPGAIRQMLVKLGKNAKVTHVHPHKFRRTTATNLIRHGMPIQEVAAILGHDKLDTTMQYVVLDKTAVQYSYKKYA